MILIHRSSTRQYFLRKFNDFEPEPSRAEPASQPARKPNENSTELIDPQWPRAYLSVGCRLNELAERISTHVHAYHYLDPIV